MNRWDPAHIVPGHLDLDYALIFLTLRTVCVARVEASCASKRTITRHTCLNVSRIPKGISHDMANILGVHFVGYPPRPLKYILRNMGYLLCCHNVYAMHKQSTAIPSIAIHALF